MDEQEYYYKLQYKYQASYAYILPDNKLTQQQKKEDQTREENLEKQKQNLQRQRQEQELKQKRMQEKLEKDKKVREEQERQEKIRQQEELAQINTLKGKFGNMINSLKQNDTQHEYTITGLKVSFAQMRILAKAVEKNLSLKGITLQRKRIDDDENGPVIVNNFKYNNVIERLELEGNQLGPKSCIALAQLFKENSSIRHIDLEGNNLTLNGTNTEGIIQLAQSLQRNETLLYFNLTNTQLNAECGDHLEKMLEVNHTIIMLDVDQNSKLQKNQVRKIQEYLKRNKRAYDDERYKEFIERKKMYNEMNISKNVQSQKQTKAILQMNLNTRTETKKQDMDEKWQKELDLKEILRQKQIYKLEKESKLKKGKKKKRGKKKG